jgi:ribosomal protein S18 acetylase RimI-like enzyme
MSLPLEQYRPGLGDYTGREIRLAYGLLEYRLAPGYTVEIVNIDVDGNHRRKGVGRSLVQQLELELQEAKLGAGVKTIFGFTSADNRIAIEFYVSLGFSIIRISGYYGRGRDAYLFYKEPTR